MLYAPPGLPDLNKYTESQREDMFKDARMEACVKSRSSSDFRGGR